MERDLASVRKLATMSYRLQLVLAITICLALLAVAASFFSGRQILLQESERAGYHFAQLVQNLKNHEQFLGLLDRKYDRLRPAPADPATQVRVLSSNEDGPSIFEVRNSQASFIITAGEEPGQLPGLLALGTAVEDFYSNYWITSRFPGGQVFLFSLAHSHALVIPCLPSVASLNSGPHLCTVGLEQAHRAIVEPATAMAPDAVQWVSQFGKGDHGDSISFIAYRRVSINADFRLLRDNQSNDYAVASVFDPHHLAGLRGILDQKLVDGFELYAPDGTALMPRIAKRPYSLGVGFNFTLRGIIFRHASDDGWAAQYFVPWGNFFYIAQFHIVVAFVLVLLCAAACIVLFKRHARAVVLPAQRSHERMVESEGFSRAVIESARVGVCVVAEDDRVLNANQFARRWLGGTVRPEWLKSASKAGDQPGVERVLQLDDRSVQIQATRTRYEGHDATLYLLSDITPFTDAAQALTEAKVAAERANAAKTVFLSTMSHEIRTPLYGVLGTLELLADTQLDPKQRQYAQTIEKSSGSLLHIISDVLDVAKIEAGQLTLDSVMFDPLQLTEDVLQSYIAVANGRGLQMYAIVDPDIPRSLKGDVIRIKQVLSNLVSNAVKFTEQGRITLSLKVVDARSPDTCARLSWRVVDTGMGVPEEDIERLFEPFFQVPAEQRGFAHGTGLGLSICRSIAELMQGRLDAKSHLGVGTSMTFDVDLPYGESPAATPDTDALKPQTILVRAPLRELATNVAQWITRWGGKAIQAPPGTMADSASIVVEISPDHLPPLDWDGPRVVCLNDGPASPQPSRTGCIINMVPVSNIRDAIHMIQFGDSTSDSAAPARKPDPNCGSESEKLRVALRLLVAEDNPINQLLIAKQLKSLGCDVSIARDGQEALHRWTTDSFDILLTDMNMPVMDGMSLAAKLRASGEDRPIIGVTANPDYVTRQRSGFPINAWLIKPFGIEELRESLLAACVEPVIGVEGAQAPSRQHDMQSSMTQDLRSVFLKTISEDIAEAKDALSRKDRYTLRTVMHRLSGGLGMANFAAIAKSCADMEDHLGNSDVTVPTETAARSIISGVELILRQVGQSARHEDGFPRTDEIEK